MAYRKHTAVRRSTKRRRNGTKGRTNGLTKASITRAVREVEELAGDKAAEKLIIMGVAKGERDRLKEIKASIRKEYDLSPRDLKLVKVGWIFKAHNVSSNYYVFDADLVGVVCGSDGIPYAYYHTGNYYPISLSQVTLSKSTFMDENAEPVSASEAVEQAIGGGRGGYRYNGAKGFRTRSPKKRVLPCSTCRHHKSVHAYTAGINEGRGGPSTHCRVPGCKCGGYISRGVRRNPRKISTEIVAAWRAGRSLKIDNTRTDGSGIYLHGSCIARTGPRGVEISTAGYNTSTTRERLNAIPGVKVQTKGGKLYLNGSPWSGAWTAV